MSPRDVLPAGRFAWRREQLADILRRGWITRHQLAARLSTSVNHIDAMLRTVEGLERRADPLGARQVRLSKEVPHD